MLFIVQCILKIIKSFYSWNFVWCLNCLWVIYPKKIKNKKHLDNDVLIKFAILSESVKKWYFNQLCLPYLKYGKLLSWQYLPSWAKIQKNWYLINFATMGKSMGNYCFDHICHPEQTWEKSGIWPNLLPWAKQWQTWIFAQIYYPGQNCWKMSFGHFCYIEQKCGKLLLWPNLL